MVEIVETIEVDADFKPASTEDWVKVRIHVSPRNGVRIGMIDWAIQNSNSSADMNALAPMPVDDAMKLARAKAVQAGLGAIYVHDATAGSATN